jgi:two-component system, cell cycle sensor histidine kinase and response regulator CckA
MPRARPASILVVEDEAIVARDIQTTLSDLGYEVLDTAGSCEEAIHRASSRCPDLVLMDIRIQGQRDGIETAEMLRRRFRIPVVFLTAYADDTTIERAKKAQPYGYLVKPIKSNELRSVVEVSLYKHEIDTRLRERERWFSTTLRSIGDGVISTDVEGRVTFINTVAETLTGWRTEDAVARPLEEVLRLVQEDTHAEVESPILRALREGTVARTSGRIGLVAKDGAERPIDEIAAPIIDEGELLGAVMVFRDVSEQRRLQRQVELANRLSSVGTMAAGMAHEVNAPMSLVLASVQRAAELLQSHRTELHALFSDEPYASVFKRLEDIQRTLAEAAEGANRVTKIAAELRTFARPPSQQPRPVDLRQVLSWAGEVVAHQIRSRAALAMEIGNVPLVSADEARLGQVFINLLLNAAQAISPGHVKDNEVRVTARTGADGRAVVDVRDTGCGIAADVLGRIFDPFFTTKSVGTGTGLGLSICHGIVRSLGGEIQVQSQIGGGSLFRVLLPPSAIPPPSPTPANGVAPVSLTGRVLVIDDEPLIASAIRRVLEPEHQVTCVKTVREGSALVERGEAFDAILCDLLLPDVTGMDFYDDLLRTRPDVARRVIFMSGGPATPRAVEFVASVSNRCLEKPFSAATLRGAIRQAVFGGAR